MESIPNNQPQLVNWTRSWFAPVDVSSLVFFRVAFGAIMLWEVVRFFQYGWIERYFINPDFFFTFAGFHWVKPWPGDGMYIHFIALGVLCVAIMIGAFYRLSMMLFFLGFTYIFLLDKSNYLNHFYLISLLSFLMIFLPCHRSMSVDAWLWPSRRSATAPAWGLYLLRFQIAIPYIYGGIAKINGDWFMGEPLRMWLSERRDFPILGQYFHEHWMVIGMNYSGMMLDLLIVPLLFIKRVRWFALTAAVLFHLMNSKLFHIGIFPWFMIAATLMFFPPDWPKRVFLLVKNVKPMLPAANPVGRLSLRQRWIVTALAVYMFVQIAIPFRHWLYPGDVNWTEEGHRFSWHMKLRSKRGEARFFAFNPQTQESWRIEPRDYLTRRQFYKMSVKPDMIVQFSKFIAQEIETQKGVPVEIRAEANVSLNGREEAMMIDPNVNLAAIPETLAPADWIIELRTPLHNR